MSEHPFTNVLVRLFRKDFLDALNACLSTQWLSAEKLSSLQEKRFLKLIHHCKQNVPYYRNLKGIDKILSISDLRTIPLLTKKIINRNRQEFRAENIPAHQLIPIDTSGSTGEKLDFYSDKKNHYGWACTIRGDMWAGYELGDKQLWIWNIEEGLSFKSKMRTWLKNMLIDHKTILPVKNLSDDQLKHHLDRFNEVRPAFVIAYPASMAIFASFIKKYAYDIYKPKGIISASDTLFEYQRKMIEEVFQCKVLNRYGSTEVFHIAGECEEQNGMHISVEHIILEIINDEGEQCDPGEMGEIVVTDLTNYAFPFIRYKIGDLGMIRGRNCPCGRNLPILDNLEGRVTSVTVGPNGVRTSAIFWMELLKRDISGIEKYQVIQETIDRIHVKLVPDTDFKKMAVGKIESSVKEKFGQAMEVKITLEKELPLTKGGKFNYIISNVSPYL